MPTPKAETAGSTVEASEVLDNPEVLMQVAQNESRLGRGVLLDEIGRETDNEETLAESRRVLGEITPPAPEKIDNNEETLAKVQAVLSESTLASLDNNMDVAFIHRGAEGSVTLNQTTRRSSGSNEQKVMKGIRTRLRTTARWGLEPFDRKNSTYFGMIGNRYLLNNKSIENDRVWLYSRMQMKPPTNPSPMFEKRKKLFEHYFAVLGRVIDANPQSFNEKFRNQNNGRVGDREDVMQYSQDPENVKGAGKFLVMVAAGGLLALNGISDVMNKRFSFVTMVLLGSVIMLVGKKPKYAFMEGNGFNEMTRKHFDEEGTRRVMGLTGGQSNLLKSKFLELKGAVITQAHIDDLTDRKKYKGRAIPKDVAQRFLGVNSSLARNFVMNMQGIKTDRDRRLVVEYARANHGEGQMQKDVKAARGSAATTVAVTDAASGKTSEEELDS